MQRVSLEVPSRLCQASARHFMEKGGGVIINIFRSGDCSRPGSSAYVAAKHGLVGLTKALAVEWGSRGVRVDGVAPGMVLADIWGDYSNLNIAAMTTMFAANRPGTPADMGGVTVFLASEATDVIRAQTLVVDGGFLSGFSELFLEGLTHSWLSGWAQSSINCQNNAPVLSV